jgi:hypothetical protein
MFPSAVATCLGEEIIVRCRPGNVDHANHPAAAVEI